MPPSRLKQWLMKNSFTAAQLERASHTTHQSMSKYLRGEDLRFSTMRRLLHGARILAGRRVAPDEVFDFDLEPSSLLPLGDTQPF
jgi:hypothetical protein